MSQASVHKFLMENWKKKFTLRQLSQKLNVGYSSIGMSLNKMKKKPIQNPFLKYEWVRGSNNNGARKLVYWYG